jgi:hypothetical protein
MSDLPKAYEDVLEKFNYELVHKVMLFLNFMYSLEDELPFERSLSLEEIKELARDVMTGAYDTYTSNINEYKEKINEEWKLDLDYTQYGFEINISKDSVTMKYILTEHGEVDDN